MVEPPRMSGVRPRALERWVVVALCVALSLPTTWMQLFGVSATDPVMITLASAVLVLVAFGAGWLPARNAAKVQPVRALRSE